MQHECFQQKKKWFDILTTLGVKDVCKERICWLSQDNADNLSFPMLCDDYEPHIHPFKSCVPG